MAGLHGGRVRAQSQRPTATELALDAGAGRFNYTSSCSGTQYRSQFAQGVAQFHRRQANGLTLHGQAAAMQVETKVHHPGDTGGHGSVRPTDPGSELNGVVGGRVGYDGRWVGGELGLVAGSLRVGDDTTYVFPSARIWAGDPERIYAWASLLANETASLDRIAGAGLALRFDQLLLTFGMVRTAGDDRALIADVSYQVHRILGLRLSGQFGGDQTHSLGAGIGFRF
jgi:hypothetical protein